MVSKFWLHGKQWQLRKDYYVKNAKEWLLIKSV